MLAIFHETVAKRPPYMLIPYKRSVSSLKNGFLAKHFTLVYPDSVIVRSKSFFTFAHSIAAPDHPISDRFNFAYLDGVYCIYQGFIKDIDAVKRDFNVSEIDDEGVVMIRAFQIWRNLGQRVSKQAVENLFGKCIAVFCDLQSKLVVLASGSCHDLHAYWNIDSRHNIVISSDEKVVERACRCYYAFCNGKVYASCNGRTGKEALFLNKILPYKVDFSDTYFPISKPVETIRRMILQADSDRSEQNVLKSKWEPPLPDFVKINTDGVKFSNGTIGIGIVIRNSNGEVEYAVTKRSETDLNPELRALLEGFQTAAGLKYPCCVCESVHLNLEMMEEGVVSDFIEEKLREVKEYVIKDLGELGVSFVCSDANRAANRLALHAEVNGHVVWNEGTPECIGSIVEADRITDVDVDVDVVLIKRKLKEYERCLCEFYNFSVL